MKSNKKILVMLLMAAMVFSLCACADSGAPAKDMQSVLPGADSSAEEPVQDGADEVEETNKDKEIAESFVGEEVSKLYEAIGEPADSSYASSCLGEGEDGEAALRRLHGIYI